MYIRSLAYLLSSYGDAEGFMQDWDLILPSDYADKDWVQIYETSGARERSFYATTHGLILQSLIRLYVNDYWGQLELGNAPVWGAAVVKDIRTRLGLTISGTIGTAEERCEITAGREIIFKVNEKTHTFHKNDRLQYR